MLKGAFITIIISPPPSLNEVVAKVLFPFKVCLLIYAIVHAVILSKKYQRSSSEQEDGLMSESRHHFLLVHQQAYMTKKVLQNHYIHMQIGLD